MFALLPLFGTILVRTVADSTGENSVKKSKDKGKGKEKVGEKPGEKSKDKGKGKEKVGEKSGQKVGRKKKKPAYGVTLTLPSRTGGQDLVRKAPRQRVHRTCHRCQTDFAGEKICKKCSHTRCKNCPREPLVTLSNLGYLLNVRTKNIYCFGNDRFKKNKPPGYYDGLDPDDSEEDKRLPARPRRTYKRPRRRVHWICTKCSTTFIEKTKICEGCGSNRDDTGLRDP